MSVKLLIFMTLFPDTRWLIAWNPSSCRHFISYRRCRSDQGHLNVLDSEQGCYVKTSEANRLVAEHGVTTLGYIVLFSGYHDKSSHD
jgi:hypothetical protein